MWLLLALLTAFFISLQDVFGKKVIHKVDVYVVAWAWIFFTLPFLYIGLFIEGIPTVNVSFGLALGVSTIILIFASILYFKAIQNSDLSLSMPMLAFTPLFLLIISPLILGEFPSLPGLIGILFIVSGSYVLNFRERDSGHWGPFKKMVQEKGPRYMLCVAFLYSIGANMDKIGVLNSSALMWIASLNTLLAIALGIIMKYKVKTICAQIKSVWPILLIIGLCNAAGLICQMTAIKMTIVPYLIAVKRTSIVMSALFGFFVFREKKMKERLCGIGFMILGVFIISMFQ